MISLEKWNISTPLQKLPKYVGNLDKIIVETGFEKLPKEQLIAQSGHTARCLIYHIRLLSWCLKWPDIEKEAGDGLFKNQSRVFLQLQVQVDGWLGKTFGIHRRFHVDETRCKLTGLIFFLLLSMLLNVFERNLVFPRKKRNAKQWYFQIILYSKTVDYF